LSLTSIIGNTEVRLTESDRKLVAVILANPTEVSYLSTTDIAERVNVHPATVVRLAKKLGFSGYPELRAYLQADIISNTKPAERVRESLAPLENGAILSGLIDQEIETLRAIDHRNLQPEITRAAHTIIAAEHVFIFGQGNSTTLVELINRRLRRDGYHNTILGHQDRELAERILPMGPKDVLLAFGFHSVPRGLSTCLHHAREVSAKSILICDTVGPLVRPEPDIHLMANRGSRSEFLTLAVPMAICNALVLTISSLDKGTSIGTLERLVELTRRFKDEPEIKTDI